MCSVSTTVRHLYRERYELCRGIWNQCWKKNISNLRYTDDSALIEGPQEAIEANKMSHRGCFPYKTRTFNRAQICTNFKNIKSFGQK